MIKFYRKEKRKSKVDLYLALYEKTFGESVMKISYDKYDSLWEIFDMIKQNDQIIDSDTKKKFSLRTGFPTVEQMEAMDLKQNFPKYYAYIMYYYMEDMEELKNDPEYLAAKRYIRNLVDECLEVG